MMPSWTLPPFSLLCAIAILTLGFSYTTTTAIPLLPRSRLAEVYGDPPVVLLDSGGGRTAKLVLTKIKPGISIVSPEAKRRIPGMAGTVRIPQGFATPLPRCRHAVLAE